MAPVRQEDAWMDGTYTGLVAVVVVVVALGLPAFFKLCR